MAPTWDYGRRRDEGDFGDAEVVTAKELRTNLTEVLKRVAAGEQILVTQRGKPFVAIVAPYDMQACQALEDYFEAEDLERMKANGELDGPGIPWEQLRKELDLGD